MGLWKRDINLFGPLAQQVDILCDASALFLSGLEAGYLALCGSAAEMKQLEQKSDEIVAQIAHTLATTYVTPCEPQDLHNLTVALDDVLDSIEQTTYCIGAYRLEPIAEEVIELGRFVDDCCRLLKLELHSLISREAITEECARISFLETKADSLQRQLVSSLFVPGTDPVHLLKRKEIYELLEAATDRCEDASVILSRLSLEYT